MILTLIVRNYYLRINLTSYLFQIVGYFYDIQESLESIHLFANQKQG